MSLHGPIDYVKLRKALNSDPQGFYGGIDYDRLTSAIHESYIVRKSADAVVLKDGDTVVVVSKGKVLATSKCLGQALMEGLEQLIDEKEKTGDKLVKVVLGPYRFRIIDQPIVIIDIYRKFVAEYPFYQTGIAIIGSEPMTTIECADGLPTCLTIRNSTVALPYMSSNVYLDKLYIRHRYGDVSVDIVNVGTLWIGFMHIDATGSKIGFRAVHSGAGDHRSWIGSIRVNGAEVNVIIQWDFRWIGNITTVYATKHHAIVAGINYCDFLHVLNESDGMPPPVVLRGMNYIRHIRRETSYLASDEFLYLDITNRAYSVAGLVCDIFTSDRDWYGSGKSLWKGNLGPRGVLHIRNIISGVQWLGEVLERGTEYTGPYKRLEIGGKTVLEIEKGGVSQIRPLFSIGGTPVSVPAGGVYEYAKITIPAGRKLVVSGIVELYDVDGYISAEVYNETDAATVVSVDGEDWNTYEVSGEKTVSFRIKNADTAASHVGAYVFIVSIVES